jgi:hypothetical protein
MKISSGLAAISSTPSLAHHNWRCSWQSGSSSVPALLRLLAIFLFIFVTPMFLGGGFDSRVGFDGSHKNKITQSKPDYVFIGSSMLVSRLDVNHFNTLLPQQTGYLLGDVGSLSALWYLWLKNSLIASKVRPKTVFILFRRTALTNPTDDTSSLLARRSIYQNSQEQESVYNRVMGYHKGYLDYLEEWFLRLYPIQEKWYLEARWLIGSVGYLAALPEYREYKWQSLRHPEQIKSQDIRKIMTRRESFSGLMEKEVFSSSNQRDQKGRHEPDEIVNAHYDFKKRLPLSFVPEMVRLGHKAGLKLVFVRIQSRPNRDNSITPSRLMDKYMVDFSEYAQRNGIFIHDFTGDPKIPWSHYQDGGHIAPPYKKQWTENFVRKLGEHLQ